MTNIFEILFALLLGFGLLGSESQVAEPVAVPRGVAAPTARPRSAAIESPMLALLTYTADTPENRKWLTMGDASAWYAATGVVPVESIEELRARPHGAFDQFVTMTTATLPPHSLAIQDLATNDLREELGFNFFDAGQYLEAGFAPSLTSALVLDVPANVIAEKLLALGYDARETAVGTLYSVRGDYETDLAAAPLRRLATYNRIVIIDRAPDSTVVLIARGTPEIESAIDAASHPSQSLAGDPYYAALGKALASNLVNVPGALVGMIFQSEWTPFDPTYVLRNAENASERIAEVQAWDAANPFDPWVTSTYVTTIDGDTRALTVLLAYAPTVDAEANAVSLATRAAEWRGVMSLQPGNELWQVLDSGATTVDGVPIVWVTLQPTPDFATRATWINLISRGEVGFATPTLAE